MKLSINKEKDVKIKIDPWDTWSVDHTLALILVPLLTEYKNNLHGAPMLTREGVSEEFISEVEDEDWTKDDPHCNINIFRTWENILDEMIWTFEQIAEDDRWDIEDPARLRRGCELFGKHFLELWD